MLIMLFDLLYSILSFVHDNDISLELFEYYIKRDTQYEQSLRVNQRLMQQQVLLFTMKAFCTMRLLMDFYWNFLLAQFSLK